MTKLGKLPQIADLPGMSARQLQAAHRELFGAEHPIANCQHLRRKIAWHIQAAKLPGSHSSPPIRAPNDCSWSKSLSQRRPGLPRLRMQCQRTSAGGC